MSLYQAKMPSLRDKLTSLAEKEVEVPEVKEVEKKEDSKVTKGRRLNK